MGQSEKRLEPCLLTLAKELHVLKPFPAGQQRAYSDHQNIEEEMFGLDHGIGHLTLMRPPSK